MITMKFGGTSMGSAPMIATVGGIIQTQIDEGQQPCVVVSAMSGVTDQLLTAAKCAVGEKSGEMEKVIKKLRYQHQEAAKELVKDPYLSKKLAAYINESVDHFRDFLNAIAIIGEISPLSHDEIVSLGEKLSAALLAHHLQDRGAAAEFVDLSGIVSGHFEQIDSAFFDSVESEVKDRLTPLKKRRRPRSAPAFSARSPAASSTGSGAATAILPPPSSAPPSTPKRSRSGRMSTASSPPIPASSNTPASCQRSPLTKPASSPSSAPRCSTRKRCGPPSKRTSPCASRTP